MKLRWLFISAASAASAAVVVSMRNVRRLHSPRATRATAGHETYRAPTGPQRVAVILNPIKKGAGTAEELITRYVEEAGWEPPRIFHTTADSPGAEQAELAMEWGADVVLACGGDGTVRMAAGVLKHTAVALAVVPLGTGNLLARNLHIDVSDLSEAIRVALFGSQRKIDTGHIEIQNDRTGAKDQGTFLVIAGIGLDGEMVSDTIDGLKKSVGWLAYSEAGLRHLAGRRKKVSVSFDGRQGQNRMVRSVLFCNCGVLPAGIDFAPDALIDDGVLDVIVISPRSIVGWMAMSAKVFFGRKRHTTSMTSYQVQDVVLHSSEPQATQLDGDPGGYGTLVRVSVDQHSLVVRVP